LTFYASSPDAGPTEAGRAIGVSRQTVYTYLAELEAAGRIARNDGSGIEVVGRG
jgi:DNA-binding GntR family transcriptional regulator